MRTLDQPPARQAGTGSRSSIDHGDAGPVAPDRPHDPRDPEHGQDAAGEEHRRLRQPHGLEDGLGVGDDDQASGRDPEHRGRDPADQPGRDRGGDHTADQERAGVAPEDALAAEGEQEPQGAAHGDDELRGVDRADDLARLQPPRGQEAGRAHRAPAAATDGVHGAGHHAHGREEEGRRMGLDPRPTTVEGQEAKDDIATEQEQEPGHPGLGGLAVDVGQERRAGEGAGEPGDGEDADRPPVHVSELVVGHARDQRGADLGEVDGGRRGGGCHPGRQEQGRRRDAVRHAERTVDELGHQADESENDELAHCWSTPSAVRR